MRCSSGLVNLGSGGLKYNETLMLYHGSLPGGPDHLWPKKSTQQNGCWSSAAAAPAALLLGACRGGVGIDQTRNGGYQAVFGTSTGSSNGPADPA